MKLLENVRAAETSDVTVATMMKWGTRIGKWTILAGNCNGFVGNRMIGFYSSAARSQLTLGVLPSQVDKGRKGQKTKAGWYDYDDKRRPSPSPVVHQILRKLFPAKGGSARTADDITKALYIPLINEGFKILEEGMAQRPADID